jgi:hypothetical protein
MYFLGYIYATLFVLIGAFLSVYVSVLMDRSKAYSIDGLFRYVGAAFFIIIFFGSVISWLSGCTLTFQSGLPTFGIEERVTVIG